MNVRERKSRWKKKHVPTVENNVGPSINFKQRFRIHKSDIKTNKDRSGTARHFNNKCCSPNNKHVYLVIPITEQVFNNNQFSIEDLLWE